MSDRLVGSAANYDGSFLRWLMGRSPAPTPENHERWSNMMRELAGKSLDDYGTPDLRNVAR